MNLAEETIVGQLDHEERRAVVACARDIIRAAPLFSPALRGMTVRISNAGAVGWHWGQEGPRYFTHHPITGTPWPDIPELLTDIFHRFAGHTHKPDCAHLVWYVPGAKLGPHQDKTEADKTGKVVTLSEGSAATWLAGEAKSEMDRAHLPPGSVTLLGGPTRMLYHGIDPVTAGADLFSESFLDAPGRLAVSIRSGAA